MNWRAASAPSCGRSAFDEQLRGLLAALDAANEASAALDAAWGRLRPGDLVVNGEAFATPDAWWSAAQADGALTPSAAYVMRCYGRARERMREAEQLLRPWVIRHSKPKLLPQPFVGVSRRRRVVGGAISADTDAVEDIAGIGVEGEALLPFLLASRASSQAPESRPVFAEGLASSYEAFLHTRRADGDAEPIDGDDDDAHPVEVTDATRWYLERLERLLPKGEADRSLGHPKVTATVKRVLDLWRQGEKAVVFCHYIATGKVLRQHISNAIEGAIQKDGSRRLGCPIADVPEELERVGRRFFDEDSPVRRACDGETERMLESFPALRRHVEPLQDVVRRNVRTPSFLVRYFPLRQDRLTEEDMLTAFDARDRSGLRLRDVLTHFFQFLTERCGDAERQRYIEAVRQVQTGSHRGADVARSFSDDELQGERSERLSPLVRLVNGAVRSETRQRLMLTFNTPFYPEVLVASSVLAEGVDLHLNCRHVIHHDLCWNPSTLEQRTGRVDRIGAKAERSGQPIRIYLPFIAETQDEKMYRVVMDRERWFSVVMGEKYSVDARTTDRLAERIALPEEAATALAFHLEVHPRDRIEPIASAALDRSGIRSLSL